MSLGPSLFVSNTIYSEAKLLINQGRGNSIREGVELLLTNGTSTSQSNTSNTNVGILLQEGLSRLSHSPYDTLDIQNNASSNEIRKAYKK